MASFKPAIQAPVQFRHSGLAYHDSVFFAHAIELAANDVLSLRSPNDPTRQPRRLRCHKRLVGWIGGFKRTSHVWVPYFGDGCRPIFSFLASRRWILFADRRSVAASVPASRAAARSVWPPVPPMTRRSATAAVLPPSETVSLRIASPASAMPSRKTIASTAATLPGGTPRSRSSSASEQLRPGPGAGSIARARCGSGFLTGRCLTRPFAEASISRARPRRAALLPRPCRTRGGRTPQP